jgi:hypothetical protein
LYKNVAPTNNPNKFTSIYRNSFIYEINQPVVDNNRGLYFFQLNDIKSKYFDYKTVTIKCKVKISNILKTSNNEIIVSEAIPVEVVDRTTLTFNK